MPEVCQCVMSAQGCCHRSGNNKPLPLHQPAAFRTDWLQSACMDETVYTVCVQATVWRAWGGRMNTTLCTKFAWSQTAVTHHSSPLTVYGLSNKTAQDMQEPLLSRCWTASLLTGGHNEEFKSHKLLLHLTNVLKTNVSTEPLESRTTSQSGEPIITCANLDTLRQLLHKSQWSQWRPRSALNILKHFPQLCLSCLLWPLYSNTETDKAGLCAGRYNVNEGLRLDWQHWELFRHLHLGSGLQSNCGSYCSFHIVRI